MKSVINRLLNWRLWPLCAKEMRQIRRNGKLVAMLVIPPTLNLVLLGFALNSLFVQLVTGTLGLHYGWSIPLIAGVTPVFTFNLSRAWAFRG